MGYDATMFSPMRWIPPPHALVSSLAAFEAGYATNARGADTLVRTAATRRLENQAGVAVLIVIPATAWTVAPAASFAHRLRQLLAALPSP